ncbi:hypothetical protein MHH33_10870 [Paenisporosarcina sp. FSL H8-0542]|uniref:hypothetical protein n=1 Tax=Paenisporosarcina sp. FSL H8-0542 TaxID=2921401 RepID=UPI00315AE5CD
MKNNKKTLNERTHNPFGSYKTPNNQKAEFAVTEFDSNPKNIVNNKNKNQQTNKINK